MGIRICILVGVCGNLGDGSGGVGGFISLFPFLTFATPCFSSSPSLIASLSLPPSLLLLLSLPHLLLFLIIICSSFSPSLICSS